MHFFEVFRIWEPLLLGASILFVPTTALRAIMADTLRNGFFKTRTNIFTAASGLLCIAYLVMGFCTWFLEKPVFYAALGIFGAIVMGSLVYDLWRTHEMPEEEPLFSSRRMFFTPWLSGTQWLMALTALVPNSMRWEADLPGTRWLYPLCYVVSWTATLLILSQKYDEERFFFQGTERVSWLFRIAGFVLAILALRLLFRSTHDLLLSGVLSL